MASTDQQRQKALKNLIKRRHPLYEAMAAHWSFLSETYEGGREWFECNIFKYRKEGEVEFTDRKARAYRFNHTREVVDLVGKYLFKMEITRSEQAPDEVKAFWKNATLNEGSIDDFMKRVSNRASVFGRPWVVVDRTKADAPVQTVADEKKAGVRTYAYIVPPTDALDMSYDDTGKLNWILLREVARDDEDPLHSSGKLIDRYRLWTRNDSQLFEVRQVKGTSRFDVIEKEVVVHGLGEVPVIAADDVISDEQYCSPAMIADVGYLDRAVANYLSNMDAIIQDQTFSQLAMPAQSTLPGDDAYQKLVEMGTKRIFLYNGEGGGKPEFISPDVKQAELILKVINKIINEIYHSVGLAGERTKEDNALGIDNSSGVAKAYDFERVNSLLASKADALELVENKLVSLVCKYAGKEPPEEKQVLYPDNFDVRGLYDEFEIASRLALIDAPDTMRREQMASVIDKLFPMLKADIKKAMLDELKTWPPEPVLAAPGESGSQLLQKTGKNVEANKLVKSE